MNAITSMFANAPVQFAQPQTSSRDLSGKSGIYTVTFKHIYQNEFTSTNGPCTSFNILGDGEMVGNPDFSGRIKFTLFVPNPSSMRDWERALVTDFMYLSGALQPNAAGGYDVNLQTQVVERDGRTSTEVKNLEGVRMVVALEAVPGKSGYGPSLRPKAFFNPDRFCTYELTNGAPSAEIYKKFLYLNEVKEIAQESGYQSSRGGRTGNGMGYNMAPPAAPAVNPYAMVGGAPAPQAPAWPAAQANPYAAQAPQQYPQANPYATQGAPAAAPAAAPAPVNPYAMQGQPQPQQAPAGNETEEIPF